METNELYKSYQLFGANVLLTRLKNMAKEIEGVCRAEDIECIHRMRVASRRMRSALVLFEKYLPGKAKGWRKEMRGITRALGEARDADIQIEFLQGFLDNLTESRYRPGIQRLLLRIKQQREGLQKKVIKAMNRLKSGDLLDDISHVLGQIRAHAEIHHVGEHSYFIHNEARAAMSLRLEEMLSYEHFVSQPDRLKELHAMRIAAKRLRYTMEVFEQLYPDDFKQILKLVRDIQTLLGDLHDCDVWVNYLPQFLDEERKRILEYFGHAKPLGRLKTGILYLQQERHEQRDKYYHEFVDLWKRTRATWDNLMRLITQSIGENSIER